MPHKNEIKEFNFSIATGAQKKTHQKSEEKTLPVCCNWTIKAKKTEQNEMRKKDQPLYWN